MDTDSLTLERLAREHVRDDMSIDADPTARRPFATYNVVGSFAEVEAARGVLRTEQDSGVPPEGLSVVLVGGAPLPTGRDDPVSEAPPPVGPDPEGVAGDTARRMVPGAMIGGLVLAVLVGLGTALFTDMELPAVLAAVLGAAAAGAVVGAIVGAFRGFGNSEAFRHTFTDVQAGVTLVGVHTDSATEAQRAEAHFVDAGALRVWVLDRHGAPIDDR